MVHEQPDLSRVPSDLHDLLSWCLSKRAGDRPAPSDLISAVRAHPAVGHRLEFTDGWLPRQVGREISGHVEQAAPAHDRLTLTAPAAPSPRAANSVRSDPPSRRARRRGRRLPVIALSAVSALLPAGAAAYHLDVPDG
ncbi:hypothetical protein [Streptomyces sp. NPDC059874]|uniref:hypothetical protein n=1 Tax=Streptomyces sp. NPDC059874 TaxID=3346983 RepID=UPI003647CA8D